MTEVREIIIQFMEANNYDGLYTDNCACKKDDLFCCGEFGQHCRLGVIVDCKDLGFGKGEFDYCIGAKRTDPEVASLVNSEEEG